MKSSDSRTSFSLTAPSKPFARIDYAIAAGLTLIAIALRLMAMPASLWEWDDFLFARAIHRYSLLEHSPHPPGFPVFVLMAKGVDFVVGDVQQALLIVAFTFSVALLPCLFCFYRELFRDRDIATAASIICFLAPNVLIHSGAGRSDGPALTVTVICLTLALRGMSSSRSLLSSSALFGLGLGIRVTLLPAVAPLLSLTLLLRLLNQRWKLVMAALLLIVATMLSWYVPVVRLTTWQTYQQVMKAHTEYAFSTDSIGAKSQKAELPHRFQRFFLDVWGREWIAHSMYLLAALGIVLLALQRQWRELTLMALAFVPYVVFVVVVNTPLSAPLYSLPYIPLFTGLAGAGIVLSIRRFAILVKLPRVAFAGIPLAAGFAVAVAGWTYPVVAMMHREKSPPVRALEHLRGVIDARRDVIWYDGLFVPMLRVYLPNVTNQRREDVAVPDIDLIGPTKPDGKTWALTAERPGATSMHFSWSSATGKTRLRKLSLDRYLDVYVGDLSRGPGPVFLSGWFQLEHYDDQSWRWMGGLGKVALYNEAGEMSLHIKGIVPYRKDASTPPTFTLKLDGREVDRFRIQGREVDRTVVLHRHGATQWSTLAIETDTVTSPVDEGVSQDKRRLGFQCVSLEWVPTPNAEPLAFDAQRQFVSGWHPLEGSSGNYWRWASGEAVINLPAMDGGGVLEMGIEAATQPDGARAPITVELDGRVLETFDPAPGLLKKVYELPQPTDPVRPLQLKLKTKAIRHATDSRDLGVRVFRLVWRPRG